jgi:limonene-1,2-epoxide hydrolase
MALNCEKIIGDFIAAGCRMKIDEIMSYFSADAVWDNVPMNSPTKGYQAIRDLMLSFFNDADAFSVKVLRSAHEGNVVFNERVDTFKMKNGKQADVPVAGMFELDDAGKIKVWRDYFDLNTFTKQIS